MSHFYSHVILLVNVLYYSGGYRYAPHHPPILPTLTFIQFYHFPYFYFLISERDLQRRCNTT